MTSEISTKNVGRIVIIARFHNLAADLMRIARRLENEDQPNKETVSLLAEAKTLLDDTSDQCLDVFKTFRTDQEGDQK